MKVFFKRITHNDQPLLWEINQVKNRATCLYQIPGRHKKCIDVTNDQQAIDAVLKGIKGIDFNKQKKAIIVDFNLFCKKHRHTEIAAHSISRQRPRSARFFSASEAPLQIILQDAAAEFKKIKAASFDELMEKYAGSTLCYNRLYRSSGLRLKQLQQQELISDTRLLIILDMYKDQLLYKLRSEQVDTLRLLFDTVLLPAIYHFFADENKLFIPEPLALYLQEAVNMVLSNNSSNTQATSFEKQQEENPIIRDKWYSQKAFAARNERAQEKLMLLEFFCNDNMSANDVVDKNADVWLEGIRTQMTDMQRDQLRRLLEDVKQSVIEVGMLKYSNDLIHSDAFVKIGPHCIPVVKINSFFSTVNEIRSSDLFASIFKDASYDLNLIMDEANPPPVYYSLLEVIKETLNNNKIKSKTDLNQHSKSLLQMIVDKMYSLERSAPLNSDNDLTDKTINNTTTGIYLGEKTHQQLSRLLQAYSPAKRNKQAHLDKFITDNVLSIYKELRKGIELCSDDTADCSFKR